jgi:hypothetical protein
VSTEKSRLDNARLANFKTLDVGADFGDDTTELVAECDGDLLFGDGVRCRWAEIGASQKLMEVRSTYSDKGGSNLFTVMSS